MTLFKSIFLLSAITTVLIFQSSCNSGRSQVPTFAIGQKVQLGKILYQVLDAQWMAEVQGAKQPPKNRVLQLHLTITNNGAQEATLSFLRLIDRAGNETLEMAEIEGNPRWLGALRRLKPASTEEGFVYFDVPVGAYKLEVVDNSNPQDEQVAYIDIPASLA